MLSVLPESGIGKGISGNTANLVLLLLSLAENALHYHLCLRLREIEEDQEREGGEQFQRVHRFPQSVESCVPTDSVEVVYIEDSNDLVSDPAEEVGREEKHEESELHAD